MMRYLERTPEQRRHKSGFLFFPKCGHTPKGWEWRWLEYAEWKDEFDSQCWCPPEWITP